jgi:hypothetical protein
MGNRTLEILNNHDNNELILLLSNSKINGILDLIKFKYLIILF